MTVEKLSSVEIRTLFFKFFENKGHVRVKSSPLVPAGDPTLLFTNAGMVQFKQVFLGEEKRNYSRAVSIQKCMRAGGKHNDLENVGKTARHHTFFEMLGNFSFGDYFKKEAIAYAWEFVTEVIKLPPDRLWITIFRDDNESQSIWEKIVPRDRIVRLGEKDNFWQMGDTGPCGPCSEIHIDQGPALSCGKPDCRLGCDCDRYLEIWNLVFMEFNRNGAGELLPLPKPSIDTGMGLERVSAVCQNVPSNYETDLFQALIGSISRLTGVPYGQKTKSDIGLRVIADHLRAMTFMIADGISPSNEGRGYVLRRIIRRAARFGRQEGMTAPFLYQLADGVIQQMAAHYPELAAGRAAIQRSIQTEEERFIHTLNFGMKHLEEVLQKLKGSGSTIVPAESAFRLYDTYGFPLDLLEDIVHEEGLRLDKRGFDEEMENQKKRARSASRFGNQDPDLVAHYSSLMDTFGKTRFLGYDRLESKSPLLAILKGKERVVSAGPGEALFCLFRETPFYGEGGGQVGDRGRISGNGAEGEIVGTTKPVPELFLHEIRLHQGELATGSEYRLAVSETDRKATARNHTATHLLHAALRDALGDHVKQAGSYVGPERLRFDFTHFVGLSQKELDQIEERINGEVRENVAVQTSVMEIEQALEKGALAFFGDKYGDEVRVVEVPGFSRELCGGTHCHATGEIGLFAIVGESSVASGIRRIEAVTGQKAYEYFKTREAQLRTLAGSLKTTPADAPLKLERLLASIKEKERELSQWKTKSASRGDKSESGPLRIEGFSVLVREMANLDSRELRAAMDGLKSPGIDAIILGSSDGDKVFFAVHVKRDKTDSLHAGEIVKELSLLAEGTGGGKPELAQGGGKHPEKLGTILSQAGDIIKKVVKLQ
jgi:alanyl-tRNA synthetase